jgi:antagonist of KipI
MNIPLIKIINSGNLSTIQAERRLGFSNFGVPVSGFQDRISAQLANWLVGNKGFASLIESYADYFEFAVINDCGMGVQGACSEIRVNGQSVPLNQAHHLRINDRIQLFNNTHGSILYLAIAGGFFATVALGTTATDVSNGLGGFNGRPLKSYDILKGSKFKMPARRPPEGFPFRPYFSKNMTVRVIAGPETYLFTKEVIDNFYSHAFVLSAEISRVGYRLTGHRIHADSYNIPSKTVLPGAIQIPPSGDPIILMADGPVTGGYPRMGVVAKVDQPILAQLRSGGRVRFLACLPEEARLREANQRQWIEELYHKKTGR